MMTTHTNDKWPDEEDDLTWLAQNCNFWHSDFARLAFVDNSNRDYYFPLNCHPDNGYTRDQWLQRRRDLGLITEDKDMKREGDTLYTEPFKSDEPAEWLPEVGEEFEVWVSNVGYWAKVKAKAHIDGGVLWRNGSDRLSYIVSLPHEIRPIETTEQKAERELMDKMDADLEWIEKTYRIAVYNWLKLEGKL